MARRSSAWAMARRTRGSRSAPLFASKVRMRMLLIALPCTSKRALRSTVRIWSGGMSVAKSTSPENSALRRDDTSGTSTKRMRRAGGRPPQ